MRAHELLNPPPLACITRPLMSGGGGGRESRVFRVMADESIL